MLPKRPLASLGTRLLVRVSPGRSSMHGKMKHARAGFTAFLKSMPGVFV
jgi:hypothetical protein